MQSTWQRRNKTASTTTPNAFLERRFCPCAVYLKQKTWKISSSEKLKQSFILCVSSSSEYPVVRLTLRFYSRAHSVWVLGDFLNMELGVWKCRCQEWNFCDKSGTSKVITHTCNACNVALKCIEQNWLLNPVQIWSTSNLFMQKYFHAKVCRGVHAVMLEPGCQRDKKTVETIALGLWTHAIAEGVRFDAHYTSRLICHLFRLSFPVGLAIPKVITTVLLRAKRSVTSTHALLRKKLQPALCGLQQQRSLVALWANSSHRVNTAVTTDKLHNCKRH